MKKVLFLILLFMFFTPSIFADREYQTLSTTTAVATSSQLVKRGDAVIERIDFIATANGGSFAIYDALGSTDESTIEIEGSEATANNSKPYDLSAKPIEVSTGLYLVVNTGSVVIHYR